MMFGFLKRERKPEHPAWNHKYDVLSEYNAMRSRASGAQYSVAAGALSREEQQKRAKELLDALDPSYVQRMAELQAEYNATMLT